MSPVRIGITTSYENGEQRLDRRYVRAIERAGALPVVCPMVEGDDLIRTIVEGLDALVIVGGPAVTEGLVGDLPNDLGTTDPVRQDSDRRYLHAAWDASLPILGICYGMQLLNAAAGGTLYGDVERQMEGAQVHSQKRGGTDHPIALRESSRLAALFPSTTLSVNTRHLQALASLGEGYRVAATAPDGVIEAIEHENGRIFGVQFHPERMGDTGAPLFQELVRLARPTPAAPPTAV